MAETPATMRRMRSGLLTGCAASRASASRTPAASSNGMGLRRDSDSTPAWWPLARTAATSASRTRAVCNGVALATVDARVRSPSAYSSSRRTPYRSPPPLRANAAWSPLSVSPVGPSCDGSFNGKLGRAQAADHRVNGAEYLIGWRHAVLAEVEGHGERPFDFVGCFEERTELGAGLLVLGLVAFESDLDGAFQARQRRS